MGFKFRQLWEAPQVNPVTGKAMSIPILNPFNMYGRVFHFAWWGYFICFWAWYAFPPLLVKTIKADLHLTQAEIANSNIISLVATFLARLVAGTACDWVGPRWTMAGLLAAGALPIALAGTIHNAMGLCVLRFFIGIIGGCFVPCIVWTTAFFDKSIVGTANALTGGFGNAGSGISYFVMPALFDSLVRHQHLSDHVAWRVTFIIPFILTCVTILAILLLTDDTPTGSWSARALTLQRRTDTRDAFFNTIRDRKGHNHTSASSTSDTINLKQPTDITERQEDVDYENQINERDLVDAASWELVKKPTTADALKVICSLPVLAVAVAIFCTFGPELAVNSFLGAYYYADFPSLGQTGAGAWAAMYGLLNFIFRPLGGIMSDTLYKYTRSLWAKKLLIVFEGIMLGIFAIIIGTTDQHSKGNRIGLVTAFAFFTETGSGAIFALVPHVHPTHNGLVTGFASAAADLGGIVYLMVARYEGTSYGKVFWVLGAANIAGHLAISWIRPIPKGQLGGR